MKTVSVVVVTKNRSAILAKCLESLERQIFEGEFDIVVADDGSTDDTPQVVQSFAQRCRCVNYVRTPGLGSTEASHQGFRSATGDIIAYADDDTVCDPHWLQQLVAPFSDPRVACVGGRIEPEWQCKPAAWVERYRSLLAILDLGPETFEVQWPTSVFGCNIAVERNWFLRVGGFNPDLIGDTCIGDGETGFQLKLWGAGARVVYCGTAVVHHLVSSQRMTTEYLRWRFGIQGCIAAYLALRQEPNLFLLAARIPLLAAARFFFIALRTVSATGSDFRRQASFRAEYCRMRLGTEWSFLVSPAKRYRAFRNDWLNSDPESRANQSCAS